jgi:hypothetical protein
MGPIAHVSRANLRVPIPGGRGWSPIWLVTFLLKKCDHDPTPNNQSSPVPSFPIPPQAGEEPLTAVRGSLTQRVPSRRALSLAPGGRGCRVRGSLALPGILSPLSEKGSPSPAGILFSFPAGILIPTGQTLSESRPMPHRRVGQTQVFPPRPVIWERAGVRAPSVPSRVPSQAPRRVGQTHQARPQETQGG